MKNFWMFILLAVTLLFLFSCDKKTTEPLQPVAKPTFSPPGDSYSSPQNVTINCATPEATIRYTIDGSNPIGSSHIYTKPITVSESMVLRARAFLSESKQSEIATANYSITNVPQKIATPTFSPPGGFHNSAISVTITCPTPGVTIRYTTNGSDPTENSFIYANPISLSSNTVIKAKAYKTDWISSDISSEPYTFPMITTVFVEGGTYRPISSNVTISSFYISKYEITQSEYYSVTNRNPSNFSGANLPVENISWFNAIEFCNRLSISEGLTPCYSYSTFGANPDHWPLGWNTNDSNQNNVSCNWNANGYRLPTEFEWEFAARGGRPAQSAGTFNTAYSGSNAMNNVGVFRPTLPPWPSSTAPVGSKSPNELGIFDMSGNVWEWCWDRYDSNYNPSGSNPTGPSSGVRRVNRGGSWNFFANWCSVDYRGKDDPTHRDYDVGLRVIRKAN